MEFRDSSMRAESVRPQRPPPQPSQMIDESQINMNALWTIHVDNTHTLPTTFANGNSAFHLCDNTSQTRVLNDILTPLLQHNETANFRDIISTYLKLPTELWRSLRPLGDSPFAQNILRDNLPTSLWHVLVKLRDDIHFEPLQAYVVDTFAQQASIMVPTQTHSRSASGASWYDGQPSVVGGAGRPALHPSHATSPSSGFQFSSPNGADHSMQTRSVTPVSIVYSSSRNNSRSPWRSRKGKAPLGQLYVCPSSNCTKKGFKNVGNYINHMLRLHAEYPRHDPESSLRPESSPPIDNGEEFVSPASTTTASNSPLYVRHLSQDWSNIGELHPNLGTEELQNSLGYSTGSGGGGGTAERFDLSSSFTSDSGGPNINVPDNSGAGKDRPGSSARASCELSTDEEAEESGDDVGGNLSFGMFQASIMSARRSGRNKRYQ